MSELEDSADHLVVVGRGKVIADKSVADMITAASGDRVRLRTAQPTEAIAALTREGATVAASVADEITIQNLSAERSVASLTAAGISFSEVSAHRATLEEAYMELTRDAVEYRGGALS
jgi:ABC-2 type transport system ATP-binding protein